MFRVISRETHTRWSSASHVDLHTIAKGVGRSFCHMWLAGSNEEKDQEDYREAQIQQAAFQFLW